MPSTRRWTREDFIAAFWAKIDKKSSPHGCWLWTGRTLKGYGHVSSHQAARYMLPQWAYAIAWVLTYGPVPKGKCVCHNCPGGDNRACCNPAHLWLGTHAQNAHDRHLKGHTAVGEHHGSAKLSARQVYIIRWLYAITSVSSYRLSVLFGVSRPSINRIIRRHCWK